MPQARSHNRRGVLMECSKAELLDLGVHVDA
jgi:hypothetical protein